MEGVFAGKGRGDTRGEWVQADGAFLGGTWPEVLERRLTRGSFLVNLVGHALLGRHAESSRTAPGRRPDTRPVLVYTDLSSGQVRPGAKPDGPELRSGQARPKNSGPELRSGQARPQNRRTWGQVRRPDLTRRTSFHEGKLVTGAPLTKRVPISLCAPYTRPPCPVIRFTLHSSNRHSTLRPITRRFFYLPLFLRSAHIRACSHRATASQPPPVSPAPSMRHQLRTRPHRERGRRAKAKATEGSCAPAPGPCPVL